MQKIYVLLRNDQQTGPYSLQELIQFDLKPHDLIWIEGKSAGWWYPQEIGALQPYLNFLPQKPKTTAPATPAATPVFVASPPVKEEPQFTPPVLEPTPVAEVVQQPVRPASANLEEAIFAQFREPVAGNQTTKATPSPTRRKKTPSASLVALTSILIIGGVFAASWLMNRQPAEDDTAGIAAPPTQNEITTPAVATADNPPTNTSSKPKRLKQKNTGSADRQQMATRQPATRQPNQARVTYPETKNGGGEVTAAPPEDIPVTTKEETSNTAKEPAAPQEKKKSLRDKIFDIFRRKPDEQKQEEAKPVDTENGERRAKRRDEATNLAQQVSIRFDVPNSWMMGIKGARAILYNRGNETITKAVIEISYYDDDNELLQKKTVTFTKINAKDSKTVVIPDHATATKVEYSIVLVEGPAA